MQIYKAPGLVFREKSLQCTAVWGLWWGVRGLHRLEGLGLRSCGSAQSVWSLSTLQSTWITMVICDLFP